MRPLWVAVGLNLALTCTVLFFYFFNSGKNTIVYVDALKIIKGYKGTVDVRRNFNSDNEKMKANLDTLGKELQLAVSNFESSKKRSATKTQLLMEQLVKSKQQRYLEYQDVVKEQYQKQEQELSIQLLTEVNDYISKYGKKNGYSIILAATNAGNIAYGDKSMDVTDDVLKGLNGQYQSKKHP